MVAAYGVLICSLCTVAQACLGPMSSPRHLRDCLEKPRDGVGSKASKHSLRSTSCSMIQPGAVVRLPYLLAAW